MAELLFWPALLLYGEAAVGYLGDANSLASDLRERELALTPRKPIGEFVFSGAWGHGADWAR